VESVKHHVGDENMGVWVGVLEVGRGIRCEPIQEICKGRLDSLSDGTARLCFILCAFVVRTIEQQKKNQRKEKQKEKEKKQKYKLLREDPAITLGKCS